MSIEITRVENGFIVKESGCLTRVYGALDDVLDHLLLVFRKDKPASCVEGKSPRDLGEHYRRSCTHWTGNPCAEGGYDASRLDYKVTCDRYAERDWSKMPRDSCKHLCRECECWGDCTQRARAAYVNLGRGCVVACDQFKERL